MGLLQLVHCQVHSASPAIGHHIAVSCDSQHRQTHMACLETSVLRPPQPVQSATLPKVPSPATPGREGLQVLEPQAIKCGHRVWERNGSRGFATPDDIWEDDQCYPHRTLKKWELGA